MEERQQSPVDALPELDARLFREMLSAYMTRRLGAQRHHQKSVDRDQRVLLDFLGFAKVAPWYWTEESFEQWSYEIGVHRKLAVSSQRRYQGAIRSFLAYLIDNVKFRNDVRRQYGIDLVQICHAENCIPHIQDRELAQERPSFSHAEIDQLFAGYDQAIAEAHRFGSKDFRPLQRDKTMFYLTYVGGLRASEVLALNTTSFCPNPDLPELGDFGFISVWGKGSRGSGPRHRMVPVTEPALPELLCWYLRDIRPNFLQQADANEPALFLSERGKRLALSSLENRFQHGLDLAGLDARGFTPHCLRHSSVTHESQRFSTEMVRRKHGHTYQATTQGYMHVPDDFVNAEITRSVGAQLDRIFGPSTEGESQP